MKAVNQTPTPAELTGTMAEPEQIPVAVESFVHNLGIALTEEQKTQLHGLLKRSGSDTEDPTKRRKTDGPGPPAPAHCGVTFLPTMPHRGGIFRCRTMTCGHGKGQKILMWIFKNQTTFCKLLSLRAWQHLLHRFAALAPAQQGHHLLHRPRT